MPASICAAADSATALAQKSSSPLLLVLVLLEEGVGGEAKSFVELPPTSSSRVGEDETVIFRIRRFRGEFEGEFTSSSIIIIIIVVVVVVVVVVVAVAFVVGKSAGGGSRG
jgi:hypothetical protein